MKRNVNAIFLFGVLSVPVFWVCVRALVSHLTEQPRALLLSPQTDRHNRELTRCQRPRGGSELLLEILSCSTYLWPQRTWLTGTVW